MLWRNCLILLIFAVSAFPAVLPSEFNGASKTGATIPALLDRPVWEEYGLEASERAVYGGGTIAAYRFHDSTGAFAALQWLRGDSGVGGMLVQVDNYLLLFDGTKPTAGQIQQLGNTLPNRRRALLPQFVRYLPEENRISGSERYIAGPASLAKFEPRLPASVVAFEKGAEAEVARYQMGDAEEQLLLVSYPTPQIAMERLKAFQGIAGALRRSGPMLIAVPAPVNASEAQALVSRVGYNPNVMWNEKVPVDPRQVGDMLLAICLLAAGLMVGSVLLGLFFGGIRRAFARLGVGAGDESLTSLNLEQPQM